ncbi:MAG: glycogen debranching N-terminal domain-containing protein [Acidobacteriota bacterium]
MASKVPAERGSLSGEADRYYILAAAALADDQDLVLKEGDTFGVFDRSGDIRPIGLAEEGLYHEGTRYLSRLSLRFGQQQPLLLSSAIKQDNALIAVDLTNLDISENGSVSIPRGTLHLSRVMVVWDGVLYQRFTFRNYGLTPIVTPFVLGFDADFADIFEVRGTHRERRGERLPPEVDSTSVVLGYRGLDGVIRRTRIVMQPAPHTLAEDEATATITLAPRAESSYLVTFACELDSRQPRQVSFGAALGTATETLARRRSQNCEIVTSNEQFNEWLDRSLADLSMMTTDTAQGPYPYAGVPWFSTPFGRDGIITALSCLWMNPTMAAGVLKYLAATQATSTNPLKDAQPGKILHETRTGEMAALGEIPFGQYYGSHDATPLFVMLADAYFERTGDKPLLEAIWPNIVAALRWIERDGDLDGDGFVEYLRRSPAGLVHQGWKDSEDSVFHDDGRLASGPIAMCEIQAYVYGALRGAARLAEALGLEQEVPPLLTKAAALRERFEREFWCPEINTYALALDGDKRRCVVRASNAGHVLLTDLVDQNRAKTVAKTLTAPESFSGWGIRTVADTESRYNPMSYHNGSIWPHDNALVAAGFARHGLAEPALRVLAGLFDASIFMNLHRLPELFCGFPRRPGESPTLYPVACNPQAWSSASVFLLLQSTLGLHISALDRTVRFSCGRLPEFLEEVRVLNLRVQGVSIDLRFERHHDDVGITVLRRDGDLQVVSIK